MIVETKTDWELLKAYLRDNSQVDFAELVRRHYPMVYAVALRQGHAPQLAQDATQSAFCDLGRVRSG